MALLRRSACADVGRAALIQSRQVDLKCNVLRCGRDYRPLNEIGEGNREALMIEVGASQPGPRVTAVLARLSGVDAARSSAAFCSLLAEEAYVEMDARD